MNKTISVLMPVFNREDFIERSVQSILNQTYTNVELIIFDDGSADNTYDIITNLQINNKDKKIKYYSENINHGVGYARNQLLNLCDTRYAMWQDSDDVSHPERLELQSKEMTEDKLVFCTWENLKTKKPGTTLGAATLMFPIQKDIRFDESMQFGGEDWEWIERMKKRYNETEVKRILYSIDFHNQGRIGQLKRRFIKEWGGVYSIEEIARLSYAQVIEKYEKEYGKFL